MTLHWWMHWFWVTRSAVLLLVSTTIAALPLGPHALPIQSKVGEQSDVRDDLTITDWPLHLSEEPLQTGHYVPVTYSTELWTGVQDLYDSSTAVLLPEVTETEVEDLSVTAITEPNISTYLQSGTEKVDVSGGARPFSFHTSHSGNSSASSEGRALLYPTVTEEHVFSPVSSADGSQFAGTHGIVRDDEENVPVLKSTLISEIGDDNRNFSGIEETTVSINDVPTYTTAEDNSSVLITSTDLQNMTQSMYNSSENILSDVNTSRDAIVDNLNSFSHQMTKPLVNIPRLITRDVRNDSTLSVNTSSPISIVTSHEHDQVMSDHAPLPSSLLTQIKQLTLRTGKSAGYFPSRHHPPVLSTLSPSKDGPDNFPFPQSSDISDVVQGYKQGPKISDALVNSRHLEAVVADSEVLEDEKSDSKVVWISRTSPPTDLTPEHKKTTTQVESKLDNAGMSPVEYVEMADSPYNPPESSTVVGSSQQTAGDGVSKPPPSSPHGLGVPPNRTVNASDDITSNSDHSSLGRNVTGQSKEIVKVTPPLMNSSKAINTSSHSILQSDNRTKFTLVETENVDGNASVGSSTDDAHFSTVKSEVGSLLADTRTSVLTPPTSAPGVKKVGSATAAKHDADNETNTATISTPTIVPVSNGRVATPAGETHHELDAASITGISLGILVFAGLVGAVSFVLYRHRFLNKPQTLNDKCSNPDSSGYIDDSTLRENSEEMYSLDNDSFLNSLEAMTIQNYWTDNVKHTKL